MSLQKSAPIDGVLTGNKPQPGARKDTHGQITAVEASAVPAAPAHATKAMQTRAAILTGPVLPTVLRLALPTMTVLLAQTAVNVAEAYYVGCLGAAAARGG